MKLRKLTEGGGDCQVNRCLRHSVITSTTLTLWWDAVRDYESPEKDCLSPSGAGGEAAEGRYPGAERGAGSRMVSGCAR